MKTYWDAFNEKYGKDCLDRSLTTILKAFWYYLQLKEEEIEFIISKRSIQFFEPDEKKWLKKIKACK